MGPPTQDLNYYGLLIQPYDWPYEDNSSVTRLYVFDAVLCDIKFVFVYHQEHIIFTWYS